MYFILLNGCFLCVWKSKKIKRIQKVYRYKPLLFLFLTREGGWKFIVLLVSLNWKEEKKGKMETSPETSS